jgi:hypothetical protein
MFVYGAVAELGSLAVQSVTKSLKNVARAFLVVVFLTKIVCNLPAASHDYLLPPKRLGSKAELYLFRLTKIEKSSNRRCSSQFWWAQCTESFSVSSYHGVALLAILLAMSELAQLVLDRSRYWSALWTLHITNS